MLLRQMIFCLIILSFNCCKGDKEQHNAPDLNQSAMALSSDTTNIDEDFNSFLEFFSKDTTFQLSRTVFPFQVKQYDVMNDKDTVFFKKRVEFE
jgi:hypothetical protein